MFHNKTVGYTVHQGYVTIPLPVRLYGLPYATRRPCGMPPAGLQRTTPGTTSSLAQPSQALKLNFRSSASLFSSSPLWCPVSSTTSRFPVLSKVLDGFGLMLANRRHKSKMVRRPVRCRRLCTRSSPSCRARRPGGCCLFPAFSFCGSAGIGFQAGETRHRSRLRGVWVAVMICWRTVMWSSSCCLRWRHRLMTESVHT